MPIVKGNFYNTLIQSTDENGILMYQEALKNCIENVVIKLVDSDTTLKKPGILLGKVQSGKTRAFLGIMALAFDNNYDIAIILTKGTKPLTEQTLKRLHDDFGIFEDNDKVQIHDVMLFPKNMKKYELNQKLIVVAKKQKDNLRHTLDILTTTYPDLKNKKVLIIDDEADFASISFHKEKNSGLIEQGKIAGQIDEIRTKVEKSDFLQVTATPYSLYLQPNDEDGENSLFLPKRPEFTELVPIHKDYVGGDYYFLRSQEEGHPASCVSEEVPLEELEVLNVKKKLKRADRRTFRIEEAFTSPITETFRKSIMNFIVGGCVRRIQQRKLGEEAKKYSFVIHTDQSRVSHSWQEDVVNKLNEELLKITKENNVLFEQLVKDAFNDLKTSVDLSGFVMPSFDEVLQSVSKALIDEDLLIEKVNSEKDVKALLDNKGQLKLRTPLNIFIGGQILDRGITIERMIGFYYGRNPKKFQQDTVLQHSRMYGTRSKEDLAVTRFYTTRNIYEIMRGIHEFDNALREAFINGSHQKGVYFIRKDENNKLVPCSPNKIMLSNIITLEPHKRILPLGFQTDYKTKIKQKIEELDKEILGFKKEPNCDYSIISIEQALSILDKIDKTFIFQEEGYKREIKSHKASLEYLSRNSTNNSLKGKCFCLIRTNRDISRIKPKEKVFSYTPDNPEFDQKPAKEVAIDIPAILLIRENGNEEKDGWKGSPFWWPVILTPLNTLTTIFASETKK